MEHIPIEFTHVYLFQERMKSTKTNSYVEQYKQKLKEQNPGLNYDDEPLEIPIADYKQAFQDLYEENIKLKAEIDELKAKIKEENAEFNEEQSELVEESHRIIEDHQNKKAELEIQYKNTNRKINELNEWLENQEAINQDLAQAKQEESEVESEKEIILKVLDDFIKITKSIAEDNADTSFLTSNFTANARKVSTPGFHANVEALKQALVKKVFSQNVYEFQ